MVRSPRRRMTSPGSGNMPTAPACPRTVTHTGPSSMPAPCKPCRIQCSDRCRLEADQAELSRTMASAVSEEQATAVPERLPARRAVGEPEEGHAVALRLNDGLEH